MAGDGQLIVFIPCYVWGQQPAYWLVQDAQRDGEDSRPQVGGKKQQSDELITLPTLQSTGLVTKSSGAGERA